jgi:hypothetical protein
MNKPAKTAFAVAIAALAIVPKCSRHDPGGGGSNLEAITIS